MCMYLFVCFYNANRNFGGRKFSISEGKKNQIKKEKKNKLKRKCLFFVCLFIFVTKNTGI